MTQIVTQIVYSIPIAHKIGVNMSFEIKKFLDFLHDNAQIVEYIKSHSKEDAYDLLKSLGYEFSLDEFKKGLDILKNDEQKKILFS